MDLSRPVVYRGLSLNDADTDGRVIDGIALETVDYSAVPGVGYTEKRSNADGIDASDVFLGSRRVRLLGSVYGSTRAKAFDRLRELRAVMSPSSAYAEAPTEKGYLPLAFEEITEDNDFTGGVMLLKMLARPVAGVSYPLVRDRSGGSNTRGMSIPFEANLECRDPRIYSQLDVEYNLNDAVTSESGLQFNNRGDYPAPLNALIVVPSSATAGQFNLTLGGAQMRIIIPNSTAQQTFRYDGELKILTVEENGVEVIRYDLLEFPTEITHPQVLPGITSWSWALSGGADIAVNSRVWFAEAWA